MSWWRMAGLYSSSILLALALSFSGIAFAFSTLTQESTLRAFVQEVTLSQGKTLEEADATFNDLYFKTFPCSFLQCMVNPPPEGAAVVLVSNIGHDFFSLSAQLSIILAILCALIILFSAETSAQRLKGFGIPFIVAGLNILLKPISQGILIRAVPQDTASYVQALVTKIFSTCTVYFAVMLVIGIILTGIGIMIAKKYPRTI